MEGAADLKTSLEALFCLPVMFQKAPSAVCPDVSGQQATLGCLGCASESRAGMFGLELSCQSRPLGMVCQPASPTLERPFPLCLLHIHTRSTPFLHFPLTVSVRLEEACCYTISRQSSLWQEGRQASLHPPFPQETGPISGVPLHGSRLLATQAVHPSPSGSRGNSMSVRNDATQKKFKYSLVIFKTKKVIPS